VNKTPILAALCLATIHPAVSALAQAADASDAAPGSVTGNVAVVSDYIFRGLTQTWGGPAVQGGADLTMANGFAAGVWASSISDKSYPGASLELDLYASYGRAINEEWSWRISLYSYLYPNGNLDEAGLSSRSFNTVEANAALTWKWLSVKYSHALTDYFGIDTEQGYRDDSKGTGYLQLDAAIPLDEQWSLALHAGHTRIGTRLVTPLVNGKDKADYDDVGATMKWQFAPHWSASAGATWADNHAFYGRTSSFLDTGETLNVGGTRGFAMLQGTF
jgi:uncharacterized protein (TIGR02001 family)